MDFEGFYQGGQLIEGVPNTGVPWDIGAPQPVVVTWEASGRFRGHVLDAGCGTGDNAIFLASHGHRVTAVDIAPTAIEMARGREISSDPHPPVEMARARGIDPDSPPPGEIEAPTPIISGRSDSSGSIEWVVGDASAFTGRFDTVLASALFHCLPREDRLGLAVALRNAAVDGAVLNLTSLADGDGPFAVTETELRSALGNAGWAITRFELDAVTVAGVEDLPELPVWVVEATATSRGACAATTP